MTAQDVINVLTILKANDSTSFSKIQRALKMSISQLEGIIDGLTAMGILYKSSFTSYSLTELTSKPVVSDGVRKAFEDIITNRGTYLSEELLQKVSTPFIPLMTHEYKNAPVKVMIVGQETLGMEDAFSTIVSVDDYINESIESFNKFNFGEDLRNSHFWYAFDEVVKYFNLPSRRHAYWTNLHKFQLIENDGDSVSISKLPSKDIMTMIHMQRELFLAEIKDTKPDIIIYFTGGQTWVLDHYLNNGKKLAVKAIDERSHLGIIQTEFLHCPIAICTDHPGRRGYTQAIVDHRANLLKYAADKFHASESAWF